MEKKIICTVCPIGCCISIKEENGQIISIKGNSCSKGEKYAKNEFTCPVRTLTTTVLIKNSIEPNLAVRTNRPIPKAKMFECMEIVRRLSFDAPVKMHQLLLENIADTGADLIASTGRDAIDFT